MTSTEGESLIFAKGHNSDIEKQVKDCLGSQELPFYTEKVIIFENEISLKLMQNLFWREEGISWNLSFLKYWKYNLMF